MKLATLLLFVFFAISALGGSQPSTSGLMVWLDASDQATLTTDTNGHLLKWSDKSGSGHDATNNSPSSSPQVVSKAMAKRDVVRFHGREELHLCGDILSQSGPVTIFIVSRRLAAQSSGQPWQRLVSSSDGGMADDSHSPNICFTALPDGSAQPYSPHVEYQEFDDVLPKTMLIGRSACRPVKYYSGDIAEILVYDRIFLSEDESHAILSYLHDKWSARIVREDRDWTRVGLLPNPPKRVNDDYPLSDQANRGNWKKVKELSDEFEGTSLDASKWQTEYPGWNGREPSRFSPENVSVGGGQLHLIMCRDISTNTPAESGAKQYTSAVVASTHPAFYGYYETMSRPMNSAGSSSFWFHRSSIPDRQNEIDVFEIGGKSPGFDRKLNMNLHVWETPTEKRHWNIGSSWIAPWRFADSFHVFGLEWNKMEIKYYVDGVIVRRVKNTDWHNPLHMHFDSETMPTWFGLPADSDLPSTFSIKYVRAWSANN